MTQLTATNASAERAARIAQLNDELRKHGEGGVIVVTRGVRCLSDFDVQRLLSMLASYDAFDDDNDPYGEHDFGDLTYGGTDLLWKVDYYDTDMLYGSPDPADTGKTTRVLTVMLATEW